MTAVVSVLVHACALDIAFAVAAAQCIAIAVALALPIVHRYLKGLA